MCLNRNCVALYISICTNYALSSPGTQVVQKIDLLTADIDMGKEDTFRGCQSGKIDTEVASSQGVRSDKPSLKTPTPSVSPPPYPIRDQGLHEAGQKLEPNQKMLNSQRHTSGTASRRRSQKPPPYPYASTMARVNPKAKDKGQKTPPYPFKRRLLSTIVWADRGLRIQSGALLTICGIPCYRHLSGKFGPHWIR